MNSEGVAVQFLESGTDFGAYRIEGLLGRGGMSEVYRASNPRLGNTIAVKLLTRELANDEVFRERFVRESRLAASLNHPNVIPIFDAGESDGMPYIAMRYVEGSDLEQLIGQEGPLSLELAVSIVSQIAAALDCAHSKGLIHRDVKPANVLLEGNGDTSSPHVYLSDFGVAKQGGSRSGLTSTGHFVGTVDYIAPEQIEGKPVSGATDVYSLGCVLYQCLTAAQPFDRDSDVAMIYAHLVEPPPSVSERRPDLPVELDAIVATALSKRPDDRYQTCRELVAALRAAAGLEPQTLGGVATSDPGLTRPSDAPAGAPVPETMLAADSTGPAAPAPPTELASPHTSPVPTSELPATPPPAPPTELSAAAAEPTTVSMRRLWRSKRMLIAAVAALLIAGGAAATAQTLGGGSSGKKPAGKKQGSSGSSGSNISGSGVVLSDGSKRTSGETKKTTKSTQKSKKQSSSSAQKKKKKSSSTSSALSSRRSSSSKSGSTGSTLKSRRSSSSSSSSDSTSSTLSSRRSGSSSSSSSGSTSSTLSDRRKGK
jgi:serine/threonine-protein kinase